MKINKVKWIDHPILQNLEIDFTNPLNGEAFSSIILAGENGTGKTTILSTISAFLNLGSFEYFEFIEYTIDGNHFKSIKPNDGTTHKTFFDVEDIHGARHKIRTDRGNNPQNIDTEEKDLRRFGCVFSKARADYKTKQITATTTKQLDDDKYDKDEEDDFTALKQLLVDVQNQDNAEYADVNKALGTIPKSWDDYFLTSKTFRFKNAFDNFFEKIKYEKVIDIANEKSIMFDKSGRSISIDDLSTGEKQIVFRGIYLLKNNKRLKGAAIMIDEPELSMHPKWQKNILKYYEDLFSEAGQQIAQLFIATHSEYVVERALQNRLNNLVIVLTEVGGSITTKKIIAPSVLPTITSAETNYLAFDIASNDYHIELYGYLQNKESKHTVKSCDDFITASPHYNPALHGKVSSFKTTTYQTISTYIRNAIDHPNPAATFSEDELRISINLLIELCK